MYFSILPFFLRPIKSINILFIYINIFRSHLNGSLNSTNWLFISAVQNIIVVYSRSYVFRFQVDREIYLFQRGFFFIIPCVNNIIHVKVFRAENLFRSDFNSGFL